MTKAELRKVYAHKRSQLSLTDYNSFNLELLSQFKQLDLHDIRCIHMYLPIQKYKEPDTLLFRNWLQQSHPEIRRVFPKADFSDFTIENYLDDNNLELAQNQFGIPEPVRGNVIAPTEIDLMLVPLLAHDIRGYRVGYGKGFYDRLMAQCRPDCRFIGLSFFEPVNNIDDVNEYDFKVDQCLIPRTL